MSGNMYSWINPRLSIQETARYGKGVFATRPIAKDETLIICGGHILSIEDEDALPPECRDKPIELSEWFSIGPRTAGDIPLMPQSYVNHSCSPNAGWDGQLSIVAMRDIWAGEEICYDYAMVMHSNPLSRSFWTMKCLCGSDQCRGQIAEDDWKIPELQTRLEAYFAWHNQRAITARNNRSPKTNLYIRRGRRDGWNWIDDRIVAGNSPLGGQGIFAVEHIPEDTLVCVLGGRVLNIQEEALDCGIQISPSHVVGPAPDEVSHSDHINHSCNPNLGFLGQLFLVTLRDVKAGVELVFDYGSCLGSNTPYKMECHCGSHNCRQVVTENDWRVPSIQARLGKHFQPYLLKSIEESK